MSSQTGTQPKPAACSEVSEIWKCPKSGVPPHPKNQAQNHSTILQINVNYNFGTKHDIHYREGALVTTEDFLCRLKVLRSSGPQTALIGLSFYPPSINSVLYLITRLHRRRSANKTQPNIAKWWILKRANNVQ